MTKPQIAPSLQQQRQLMTAILAVVGVDFEHTRVNLNDLCEELGWNNGQVVRGLHALHRAGFLSRSKPQRGVPRWHVTGKTEEAAA